MFSRRQFIKAAALAAAGLTAIRSKAISGVLKFQGATRVAYDQFLTDLGAGTIDGTAAEPGPGIRGVVDSESKLSISTGTLVISGGKASPAYGDPAISYPSVSRTPGRAMMLRFNAASGKSRHGWTNGGSMIEVADNLRYTPDKTPGLQLWLDAAAITGLVDGDAVSSWPDLSANGYHATQTDAAKKPTYKTNILNGKAVVRFDGGDFLASNCPADTKPVTIFFVATFTNFTTGRSVLGPSADGARQLRASGTTGKVSLLQATIAPVGTSNDALTAGVPAVCAVTFGAAGYAFYINGSPSGSGASAGTFTAGATSLIGARSTLLNDPMLGDIPEIIQFDSVLSASDLTKVTNYLRTKWGF